MSYIYKNISMENKSFDLQVNPLNNLPVRFPSAIIKKKNNKRKLPDAFYPSWELELMSSFVAIFLLWILPDWIMNTNILLSSKYDVGINSSWMDFLCQMIMAGFIASFILRIFWLGLMWKWRAGGSSHGSEMFKSRTTRQMKLQSERTHKLAITIDHIAEALFFIASIILFLTLLSYLIQVLGSLLNHSIHQSPIMPAMK